MEEAVPERPVAETPVEPPPAPEPDPAPAPEPVAVKPAPEPEPEEPQEPARMKAADLLAPNRLNVMQEAAEPEAPVDHP
jgi:hypothetical protein